MATKNIATLGIKVDPKGAIAGANKAKRAIKGIGNAANSIKNQIFSLNGALGALGAGMAVKSALNYASSIETLKIQLKFLTGDTKKAAEAFNTLTKFAKKAPFTLKEIQKAAAPLSIVADNTEELNELLSMTGDIASVTGLGFEVVSQNMLRAMEGGIGASEMFKEKGVKNMLGFVDGVQYSADETKRIFFDAFRNGTTTIKGATAEMAKTFVGQVSMMGDAWDTLQLAFMKEGVFGSTKSQVKDLTDWLKSPDVIQGAKDLGKNVTRIAKSLKDAITEYNSLDEWIKTSGLVLAVFGGKVGKAGMVAMIAYAKELKAILQEVGVVNYSPKQITDSIKEVEERIEAVKKQMGGQELSWWQEALFSGNPLIADQNMLDDLEEKLVGLREQYSSLPVSTRTSFENPLPDIISPDKPDKPDTISDAPVGGISAKRLEKLKGGVISYKDSIKDVGIEVTKSMELARAYRDEVDKVKSALDAGTITGDSYKGMLVDMTTAYGDAIKRMDEADIAKKVAGIANIMESSITDMIMNIGNGANSLKDTVKDMARAILAEFVKISVARPMANAMASGFSGMFRADGGTVTGNQPYVVGEEGAELFVPNKTGTIIPNDAMSSGGSSGGESNVSVSFNITANDTTGFDDLLDSRRGMIVGIINQAMNDRGLTGVTT